MKKIKVLLTLLVVLAVFGANAFAANIYGTGYIGFEAAEVEYSGTTATINVKFDTSKTTYIEQYSYIMFDLGSGLSFNEAATSAIEQPYGAYFMDGANWMTDTNITLTSDALCSFVVNIDDPDGDLSVSINAETAVADSAMVNYPVDSSIKVTLVPAGGQGGGNTVTAEKDGETAGDGVTAYTVSNLSGKKVMTKTFTGLTITDATRVYVTIDGEDRVFGSDLVEATNGLTIGKLTFGIIVDEDVAAGDVTAFSVN